MSDNHKLTISEDDSATKNLEGISVPKISLPNQDGNFLRLNRSDTFRMVLYFFPMTGRPDRPLPDNWNNISGAKGCTNQTLSFIDHYDEIISLNALPIGISTQTVNDNKEMTARLGVPYDVLSDDQLIFKTAINLPLFSVNDKKYFKRLTLIVEKNIIKKIFYPIYSIDKHVEDILKWLKEN